jgi:regulator of protease activity HflC (stomatin/prohibitin superfamily)
MELLIRLIIIAGGVFVGVAAFKLALQRVIVWEWEQGLMYRKGRFTRMVGPGVYWLFRPWSRIRTLDARPVHITLTGQEVLSRDRISLKVSIVALIEVVDPPVAMHHVDSYFDGVYTLLQTTLRDIIGSRPIEELLENRGSFDEELHAKAAEPIAQYGITLHWARIRDIMFPGDLKNVFAQVMKARQEGLAALEKARGETAALRHLANAAKMMDANPGLLQLRTLQTLSGNSGNTVVLTMPGAEPVMPVDRDTSGKDRTGAEPS